MILGIRLYMSGTDALALSSAAIVVLTLVALLVYLYLKKVRKKPIPFLKVYAACWAVFLLEALVFSLLFFVVLSGHIGIMHGLRGSF